MKTLLSYLLSQKRKEGKKRNRNSLQSLETQLLNNQMHQTPWTSSSHSQESKSQRLVRGNKEGYDILITIYRKNTGIANIYGPDIGSPNFIKQTLKGIEDIMVWIQ